MNTKHELERALTVARIELAHAVRKNLPDQDFRRSEVLRLETLITEGFRGEYYTGFHARR